MAKGGGKMMHLQISPNFFYEYRKVVGIAFISNLCIMSVKF